MGESDSDLDADIDRLAWDIEVAIARYRATLDSLPEFESRNKGVVEQILNEEEAK